MKKDGKSESSAYLRKKAEELSKKRPSKSASQPDEAEMLKLIHELEVHQIELELQNHELLRAKAQFTADAEKYAELYDFAPSGYFTLAANGEILELNLSGSQMLGKDRMFLRNKLFGLYVADDSKLTFTRFLDKVLNYKSKETCEVALLVNGGLQVYVNLSGTTSENGDQCLLIATDITARKKAEAELLEKEVQYYHLANAGIALTWTSGIDKLCNYFNEPWLKFTGRTLEQELGNGWAEGVHPEDLDRCLEIYTTAFDRREPFEMEYRLRHVSGEYRWITDIGTPNFNVSGEFIGYIGSCFDITERIKAEKEIRNIKEHFQALIEKAPDGIVLLDAEGNFKYISPSAKRISGFSALEEIIGNPAEYTHPDDLNMVLSALSRIIQDPSYIPTLQYRYRHKTGNWLWVESTFTNLLADSNVESILINFRNITEQKQAEEKLMHVTRLYAFLGQVNQAIVWNRHEDELFDKICNVAVEFGQFRMAWIGLTEESSERVIPVSVAGFDDGYLETVQITANDQPTGRGPSGQALQHNKLMICNDISTDPQMISWRAEALRRGYRSSASVPFNRMGKLEGTLNIYSAETDFFGEDQLKFLDEISANISFALDAMTSETERRKTADLLRKSEKQYRSLFNNFLDSVAVYELIQDETGKPMDYIFIQVNEAFTKQIGLPMSDILGKKITAIIPGIEKTQLTGICENVTITGQPAIFEQFIEPLQRYFHINVFLIGQGRFCSIFQDITERRLAEIKLQKSEERYRSLLTNLEAGVVVHAPDTTIIMNNHRAAELLGLSDDQMKGRKAFDPNWNFIDESSNPILPEEYPVNRILSTKKQFRNFILGVRRNVFEDIAWLTVNGFPVFDDKGEITEILISFIDITEFKLAQNALFESEAKFRNLVWNMQVGVLLQGTEADILMCNPKALELLGLSEDQLLGKTSFDPDWNVIHEDGSPFPGSDHPVPMAIATRHPVHDVVMGVYRPLKGDRVWLLVDAEPQLNENGALQQVVCTFVDITERKLAEEALIESERKFRDIVTYLDEGFYSVSIDGVLFEHNKALSRILGFDTNADLMGIHLPDFWQHPEERKKYLEAISANGSVSGFQIEVKTPTGEKKSVLTSAHFVKDKDEQILRIEGVFLDVTDRIRIEESLKRHTERLQNLHKIDKAILSPQGSPEAIIQKALQHIRSLLSSQHASIGIVDFENEALQLFVASIRDGSANKVEKYMIDKAYVDLEILRQNRMVVVEDISMKTTPPELLRILQSEGIMSCINVPLLSGEKLIGAMNLGWGDPRAFTPEELEIASEVADEITIAIEQVRLRQVAAQYTEDMEKMVAKRTSQLTAANKELESFSYSVSHDLRAPLRHISGYVNILTKHLQGTLPEKEKHYLDTIADSTHQMGLLIDDLLHFSRTGRQEMLLKNLDMNIVLRDALQLVKHESLGRDIRWLIADLPEVLGDYSLLRMVWLNLLSNAVKFTGTNAITQIEVGFTDDIHEVIFYVRDNGVGFDMQYAHKLFGVFERLHSAQEFEGTGIGLANVRRIILRHGGRTWAEAEVNKGATFYFSLPKGK